MRTREWLVASVCLALRIRTPQEKAIAKLARDQREFEAHMKKVIAIAMSEDDNEHTSRFSPHNSSCVTGNTCRVDLRCTREGCNAELPPGQPSYSVKAFKAAPNGVEHWYEDEGPLCHDCVKAVMRAAQSL